MKFNILILMGGYTVLALPTFLLFSGNAILAILGICIYLLLPFCFPYSLVRRFWIVNKLITRKYLSL